MGIIRHFYRALVINVFLFLTKCVSYEYFINFVVKLIIKGGYRKAINRVGFCKISKL